MLSLLLLLTADLQFHCDSDFCRPINRKRSAGCDHIGQVRAKLQLPEEKIESPPSLRERRDKIVADIVNSLAERGVVKPMEEEFKEKMRAGFDQASSLPPEGLIVPKLPPGMKCKCNNPLAYNYDAGHHAVSKVNVFFTRSKRESVPLWAVDCPNSNPRCQILPNLASRRLWLCSYKTVFSELLFWNCYRLVLCVLAVMV